MSAANVKAAPAVIIHPPITDITPVMRNTALSLLQALSARDEPIATMKVTYVVDRGSFIEVPSATSKPASTRLTEALIRSNAAPSGMSLSVVSKRLFIQWRTFAGVTLINQLPMLLDVLTKRRAAFDEPNISSPPSCRARSTDVFTTLCAFLLVARAKTIIVPAMIKKYIGVT